MVGVFHVDEITLTDIRAYREFLQEQIPTTAPATINRRPVTLRRFFSWAKENHLTESQPTERIRNVEMIANEPKSLDRKQWHRLQRRVEQAKGIQRIGDRCIILLLAYGLSTVLTQHHVPLQAPCTVSIPRSGLALF
jgi:site-specific recombinase XerD